MKQTKKILAILLTALMLLSVMTVGISATTADDTIVIDKASDWEAYRQTDGSFLLPQNGKFTVSVQAKLLNANFNGNGSTITTSVPLFYEVRGVTVENLTIEGEISCSDGDSCGVLTDYVTSTSIIKNVTSNANLTVTGLTGPASESHGVGSIVGCASRNPKITIIDCTNNGTVTVTGTYAYAGGIIGKVRDATATLINCVNNGAITASSNNNDNVGAGGIIGYHYGGVSKTTSCVNNGNITSQVVAGGMMGYMTNGIYTATDCVNNGAIAATSENVKQVIAGGMMGHMMNTVTATLINCVNNGDITATAADGGLVDAGGMMGFINEGGVATITGCGNTGDITSTWLAAGIIARNYGRPNTISACYNTGKVKAMGASGFAGGIAGSGDDNSLNYCWNMGEVTAEVHAAQISAYAPSKVETLGNYYLDTVTATAFAFENAEPTNDGATAFTAADLISGKLAYDINKAAGAQLFFQNVNTIEGEQNDAYPVPDSTHGHVFKTGDATYGSLRFYTLTTASVRISANENERGIRFSTAVNKKDFDALNVDADFGTLVTPNDFLKDAQNDFNALAAGKYLDVNSTATGAANFKTLKGEDNDTYYYFCGSITGIKAANYDWDYSAVGYVTINGETVYSTQYATRNIKFIAGEAVKDAASYTEQELEYINTYLQ